MAPTATRLVGDLAQTSTGASGAEVQLVGLMEWSIPWKRKTVDSTTTDDQGYESALGSTASWTATAKYAYIDQDASQAAVRNAITTIQTTPLKWNFFAAPGTGRDSYTGTAIIDSMTVTAGVGKIVGFDISLKGTGPLSILPQLAAGTAPIAGSDTTEAPDEN
jgi:predicted secreted protein